VDSNGANDFSGAITGYTITSPSCPGVCDASMAITFDAACFPGTYTLNFNTLDPNLINSLGGINYVVGVTGTSYTLGGLCSGGGNLVGIYLEQNGVVIDAIDGQILPQVLTPINFFGVPTSTAPSCPGQCDGSQRVRFNGGTAPYTVQATSSGTTATTVFT